jgi:hypothetical protein
VCVILLLSSNASAQEQQTIKRQLILNEVLSNHQWKVHSFSSIDEEKEFSTKLLDDLYLSLLKNGDMADLSLPSSLKKKMLGELSASSSSPLMKAGDIIIIKYKPEYRAEWSFITHDWQHAVMIDKNGYLVNAGGPNEVLKRLTWTQFTERYKSYKIEKALLLQFELIPYLQDRIANSLQSQVGKPYVQVRNILWSKYSTDTFYCSSSAWRAHFDATNRDLDANNDNVVWPYELLLNNHVVKATALVW